MRENINVVSLAQELIAIDTVNPPGHESACAEYLGDILEKSGFRVSLHELAERRASLVARIEGSGDVAPMCFTGHMDTVPLCVGVKPVVRGNRMMPAQKDKALGGDNRSGVAIVLATALEVVGGKLPHPPLTFLWTVQEELGLQGIKQANLSLLGKPQMGINFDGGEYEELTIGAPPPSPRGEGGEGNFNGRKLGRKRRKQHRHWGSGS